MLMSRDARITAQLKRHTLLDIDDSARQRLVDELAASAGPDRLRRRYAPLLLPQLAGARIPGIVRRDESGNGGDLIPVGFSSPVSGRDGRLRVAARVADADIVRITTPYQLLPAAFAQRNSCMNALAACRDAASDLDLVIGVWGSAALELYTGLSYTHDRSDLDLLIAPAPRAELTEFLARIVAIEARIGLRIDAEVDLDNGYGIHLRELLGEGRTLLGKSRYDVALLPRARVLAELPADRTKGQLADCREVAHG
jgi:phosphoribosyl-dephospho-CoA transferase